MNNTTRVQKREKDNKWQNNNCRYTGKYRNGTDYAKHQMQTKNW